MFVCEKVARGHRYLYLVESVHEGKRVRQRTIRALGRKDVLHASGALDRPIASLARHSERAMLFRTRDLLVRQRTQTIDALRGHLAEFGVIAPQGRAQTCGKPEAMWAGRKTGKGKRSMRRDRENQPWPACGRARKSGLDPIRVSPYGPAARACRIERPDTRKHLTACPRRPKKMLASTERPHTGMTRRIGGSGRLHGQPKVMRTSETIH